MSLRRWMQRWTSMQGAGAAGGLGPEQTLTLQPDESAANDTYLGSDTAGNNHGAEAVLAIGENQSSAARWRTLISFDLSSLPADAVINSATLSLYATTDLASSPGTFRVYRVKRAWIEGEATWNIWSSGNNWQTAGGFGANDCEQTDIGSRDFTATETLNEMKDFALTPTSKADLDLGNGWLIKADTESNDGYIFASSGDATSANRPKLEIKYQVPT